MIPENWNISYKASSSTAKKLKRAFPEYDLNKTTDLPQNYSEVLFWEPDSPESPSQFPGLKVLHTKKNPFFLFVILPTGSAPELIKKWLLSGADGCLYIEQLVPKFLRPWIIERIQFLTHSSQIKDTKGRSWKHIRQQQAFLRQIIDLNPNIIFVKDQDSRFVLANKAQAEAYGTSVSDLIGKSDAHFCESKEDADFYLKKDREVLDKRKPVHTPEEMHTQRGTGNVFWYETVKVPMTDKSGQTFILGVSVDITARKYNEGQLFKAKKAAEKADLMKSRFLANISHEIRTPLNSIIGFTEVLREMIHDPDQCEYLGYIDSSGRGLLALMNDILDLSKIESGKLQLVYSPISLRVLLEGIRKLFEAECRKKGLALMFHVDESVPDVMKLDESRIRQILFNLVGNAVKFTEKGSVTVEVREVSTSPKSGNRKKKSKDKSLKTRLEISVRDTGIGISAKDQASIFEKFRQQSARDNRKYQGTGLGLAITKQLIEMMDGTITLKSKPGAGSTFTITLPNVEKSDGSDLPNTVSDLSGDTSQNTGKDDSVFNPDSDDDLQWQKSGELHTESTKRTIETLRDPVKKKEIVGIINNELIPKWNRLKNSLVIKDISGLASEIMRIGKKFGIPEFLRYGSALKKEVERMDIEKIRSLLPKFKSLSENVLHYLEQDDTGKS